MVMKKSTIIITSLVMMASCFNAGVAWSQTTQASFRGNWIAPDTTNYLYFNSSGQAVEVRRLGYDDNGAAITDGSAAVPADDCNKTNEGSQDYDDDSASDNYQTMNVTGFLSTRTTTCTTNDPTNTPVIMGNADLTSFNQRYTYTADSTNGDYLTGGTDSKTYRNFSNIAALKIVPCNPPAAVTGDPTGCDPDNSLAAGTYVISTSVVWKFPAGLWISDEGFVVRNGKTAILHFQEFVDGTSAQFNSDTTKSVQWFTHARATTSATTLPERESIPSNNAANCTACTSGVSNTKIEIYNHNNTAAASRGANRNKNEYDHFLLYLDITRSSITFRHPIDPTIIDKGTSPGGG